MPEFSDTIIKLFDGLKKKRQATGEVCSQSYDWHVLNSPVYYTKGRFVYWF
jgi:hypothetical protein